MANALLNVGGGSKLIAIPAHYAGWRHDLLDIDPAGNPDIVLDARAMTSLPPATYDAVYCAHNLEHYHRHEVAQVVRGFIHVLKPDGFVEIRVPDLQAVMQYAVAHNLDLDDVLYQSRLGPILVRDVIYGYHVEIERSNKDYYAHKSGYSPKSLERFLFGFGFAVGAVVPVPPRSDGFPSFGIQAIMFKQWPTPEQTKLLGLVPPKRDGAAQGTQPTP